MDNQHRPGLDIGSAPSSSHLGTVLQPSLPERDRPALPALTALGLLSLASFYRENPEAALQLADDNCAQHWREVADRQRRAEQAAA